MDRNLEHKSMGHPVHFSLSRFSFLPSRYRLKRRCLHNLINRHKVQMAIENEQNDQTSGEANKQTNENDKAANDIPS